MVKLLTNFVNIDPFISNPYPIKKTQHVSKELCSNLPTSTKDAHFPLKFKQKKIAALVSFATCTFQSMVTENNTSLDMTPNDAKLVVTIDEKKDGPYPNELCCLGPTHLIFGDTRSTNKVVAYFLWLSSVLTCCIIFPPLATYFLIYQHPREHVRAGMNEAMSGGSAGVVDLSSKRESETGNQRVRGETENDNIDTNRLMWIMLSFMLTLLCWVPGIVFNFVLFFCCVASLQTEKDSEV